MLPVLPQRDISICPTWGGVDLPRPGLDTSIPDVLREIPPGSGEGPFKQNGATAIDISIIPSRVFLLMAMSVLNLAISFVAFKAMPREES